jgi:hypothetical protein
MLATCSAYPLFDLIVITITVLSLQTLKLVIVNIVIINATNMNIIVPINAAPFTCNLSYYMRQLIVCFVVHGLFELVCRSKYPIYKLISWRKTGMWHYHAHLSHILKLFELIKASLWNLIWLSCHYWVTNIDVFNFLLPIMLTSSRWVLETSLRCRLFSGRWEPTFKLLLKRLRSIKSYR